MDFILAVGGRSIFDCCKVIAAQAMTDRDIWELEYTDHGTPTAFTEMGITDESVLRAAADTCNLTAVCCKRFDWEEIFQLLKECL